MTSLAESDPKQITPSACPGCHRAVVVAQLRGKHVLVERARGAAGNIALTADLAGGALVADRVSNATDWRIHAGELCAGTFSRAFSAAAFDRKTDPGKVPREIFRQLADRHRRGRR